MRGGERTALLALAAFTAAAIAGFAVFGMHPERLIANPRAAAVYGPAFVVFARGQVLLSAAVLIFMLVRRAGGRWCSAFVAIYMTSLCSELAGTTVGLPFGPYRYTDGLGPKWFGHVPWLIPLSWFLMAVPSYALARRLIPNRSAAARALVGSFVLLSWDLALDPAMSHVTKYWVWGISGVYYGMPWLNLFGWYITGLVLMTILIAMHADRWLVNVPTQWMALFYAVNLALPIGLDAAAHADGAVVASMLPVAVCIAAMRSRARLGVEFPERASAEVS